MRKSLALYPETTKKRKEITMDINLLARKKIRSRIKIQKQMSETKTKQKFLMLIEKKIGN